MTTYLQRLIDYNNCPNRGLLDGVEHRAHVGTILGANGVEPPDLDSWAHGIWVHGDDWPSDWAPEPERRRAS